MFAFIFMGLAWAADCSPRKPEVCRSQARTALRRLTVACDGGVADACRALGRDVPDMPPTLLTVQWTPEALLLRDGGPEQTLSHTGGAVDEDGLQQALQSFKDRHPEQASVVLILPPDAVMRDVTPMLSASARVIEPLFPNVQLALAAP